MLGVNVILHEPHSTMSDVFTPAAHISPGSCPGSDGPPVGPAVMLFHISGLGGPAPVSIKSDEDQLALV